EVIADENPGLPAGLERAAHMGLLRAALEVIAAGLGPVLDADVEADHAERGELLGERRGDAVRAGLAYHGDLAHAVRVERLADAADALDGELLAREDEVVVVEAEDALAAR